VMKGTGVVRMIDPAGTSLASRCTSHETQVAWPDVNRLASLESQIKTLQARVDALEALLSGVTRTDDQMGSTLLFTGMNLQVVNGSGSTNTPNGLGNVIIGYNRPRNGVTDRRGSHDLVIGDSHVYAGTSGVVVGRWNDLRGANSFVSGELNGVSGGDSFVAGGQENGADQWSFVGGGQENSARNSS